MFLRATLAAMASAGAFYGYVEYEKIRVGKLKEEMKDQGTGKPLVGGPFSLVDHNGRPVTDLDFRGKYLLMYFGYTFCPDVCPEELEKMAKIVDDLDAIKKDSIVPIFISCDPKRDSVESIKEYLKEFHPKFLGLTGTHMQIKRVAKAYRLYYSSPPRAVDDDDADYLVDHSIFFYLIDPNGEYIAHFGRTDTPEMVTDKIKEILKLN
ncbi:Cu-binding protein [Nowakowskiella sp. JEL0078]|nr:Cu-binding protein [Nowakowskiella sp. JEL0078]